MTLSAQLHTQTWAAAAPTKLQGAALLLHGAESHAGWFHDVGTRLARAGLTAFAFDRTGWGQSPGPRGRLATFEAALAELTAMADGLRKDHGAVHLVGLSWGGLLAAYAREEAPEAFATVTLLAPALFPLRGPKLTDLWRAGASGLAPLRLRPADFTRATDRQALIAADPHRTTAVGRDFCLATLSMRRQVRARFLKAGGPPTQVLLAESDEVIDNQKTRALVEGRGGQLVTVPRTVHSLVLEDPAAVAEAVVRFVQRHTEVLGRDAG